MLIIIVILVSEIVDYMYILSFSLSFHIIVNPRLMNATCYGTFPQEAALSVKPSKSMHHGVPLARCYPIQT